MTDRVGKIMGMIETQFEFLIENYQYRSAFKEEESELFLAKFEMDYTSIERRRKVTISYTESNFTGSEKHTFTAMITRLPYSGVSDFFSLNVFLESQGKTFDVSIINDFKERGAEIILSNIAASLKENLSKVIEGKQWLPDYYPRWN